MIADTQDYLSYKYSPILLEKYIYSRPLYRRLLAKFFNKYKITKEEYDEWFYKLNKEQ